MVRAKDRSHPGSMRAMAGVRLATATTEDTFSVIDISDFGFRLGPQRFKTPELGNPLNSLSRSLADAHLSKYGSNNYRHTDLARFSDRPL